MLSSTHIPARIRDGWQVEVSTKEGVENKRGAYLKGGVAENQIRSQHFNSFQWTRRPPSRISASACPDMSKSRLLVSLSFLLSNVPKAPSGGHRNRWYVPHNGSSARTDTRSSRWRSSRKIHGNPFPLFRRTRRFMSSSLVKG